MVSEGGREEVFFLTQCNRWYSLFMPMIVEPSSLQLYTREAPCYRTVDVYFVYKK
jgi:hypothetical protein